MPPGPEHPDRTQALATVPAGAFQRERIHRRGLPLSEQARRLWRRLTDPALWPHERLFFELYGQALQGRPHAVALLEGIVDSWLGPVTDLIVRTGGRPETARTQARLGLAVTRGLLLDLLATGDREGVDAAMELFLTWQQRSGDMLPSARAAPSRRADP